MDGCCAKCGKPGATNVCNKCNTVKYCNKQCKKKDRRKHEKYCGGTVERETMGEVHKEGAVAPIPKGPGMQPYCANCFASDASHECGRCGRSYCSRTCQVEDWKEKEHKHYCGRSGELGTDFEIQESPDRHGLGTFALRDFKQGQIIMVEKPAFFFNCPSGWTQMTTVRETLKKRPTSVQAAVHKLYPPAGSLFDKLKTNAITLKSTLAGIAITMSRINHDCLGNTLYDYIERNARNIVTLRAMRYIACGEELTFSYVAHGKYVGKEARHGKLTFVHGFVCECKACTNPDIDRKLVRLAELTEMASTCARQENLDGVMSARKEKIEINEGLNVTIHPDFYTSLSVVSRLTYLMRKPVEECVEMARKVIRYVEMWYEEGDPEIDESREWLLKVQSRRAHEHAITSFFNQGRMS